jgi:hypothetical protein
VQSMLTLSIIYHCINFPMDSQQNKKRLIQKTIPCRIIRIFSHFPSIQNGKRWIVVSLCFTSRNTNILERCHVDVYGGHFASNSISSKALLVSYWWPTLFKDAFN